MLDAAHALQRLRETDVEHDSIRRALCVGVSARELAADIRRWEGLGEAIAALAAAITRHCAASAFCEARPQPLLLAIRLSESIDDLMDEPAWAVVDAAARLAALPRIRVRRP